MTDYTQADLDQNKRINRVIEQLTVVLAMLDKHGDELQALKPVVEVVQRIAAVADRVEQAVKRLEEL